MKPKFLKVKKKKEPIFYKDIQYDSEFEVLMAMWIEEGIEYGYIKQAVYHPKSFVLSEGYKHPYQCQLKTKTIEKHSHVFGRIVYTADWWIYWTEKAIGRIVLLMDDRLRNLNDLPLAGQLSCSGEIYSVIDVKPPKKAGGNNASYRDFAIKAPLVWDMYGIYVQEVVPINPVKKKNGEERVSQVEKCFFSRTWAPKAYLNREKKNGNGNLVIYCLNKSIEDYESSRK